VSQNPRILTSPPVQPKKPVRQTAPKLKTIERAIHRGQVKYGIVPPDSEPEANSPYLAGGTLDAVTAKPIEWLWRGYIPAGTVTLAEGDPGLGKSQLVFDLAARLTTGSPMPGESGSRPVANVIIVNGEDDLARVIKPRLMAAGADLSRVAYRTVVKEADKERPISMPEDIPLIAADLAEQEAKLIILDPFEAFLSGKVRTKENHDIRRALTPLARVAEETGAAIVLVRHLNKNQGQQAIYRGNGSIGIVGAARSALVVGRDKADPEAMILASVKSNLGPRPNAQKYRIQPATVREAGLTIEISRVEWLGTAEGVTADDLVTVDPEIKNKRDWSPVINLIAWEGEGVTAEDIHKQLPDYTLDGVRKALRRAEKSGYVRTVKQGKKGDPGRYVRGNLRPGEE
jgi:hypothetical protein